MYTVAAASTKRGGVESAIAVIIAMTCDSQTKIFQATEKNIFNSAVLSYHSIHIVLKQRLRNYKIKRSFLTPETTFSEHRLQL